MGTKLKERRKGWEWSTWLKSNFGCPQFSEKRNVAINMNLLIEGNVTIVKSRGNTPYYIWSSLSRSPSFWAPLCIHVLFDTNYVLGFYLIFKENFFHLKILLARLPICYDPFVYLSVYVAKICPCRGALMDDAMILPCGHSFGDGGIQQVIKMVSNLKTSCKVM